MKRLLVDTSAFAAFMRGDDGTVHALHDADEISRVNLVDVPQILTHFIS